VKAHSPNDLGIAHCMFAAVPAQLQPAEAAKAYEEADPPLWNNLGSLTYPISTKSTEAQAYFNQGLRFAAKLQPRRSTSSLPQGSTPGSELRAVLPRRGLGARSQYQRADGARGECPRGCGAQKGAGACSRCEREGEGADRGGSCPVLG
jgi:hypothetical protein